MSTRLRIRPGALSLQLMRDIWEKAQPIELDPGVWDQVEAGRETVRRVVSRGDTVYGINTGFGLLARTRIKGQELETLQRNLVLSHSTGVGDPLPEPVVRLALVLKIASLAQGYSGVQRGTIDALITLVNEQAWPVIPAKGSVGASGDLAPLAHLSAVLLGEGLIDLRGERLSAAEALEQLGLAPVQLGPKEGLALLNGTQVSTALALNGLFRIERVFSAAVAAGALSVDAAMGSDTPFDARIHQLRRHPGQQAVAESLRRLLSGSEIRASHTTCDRVQDPYCLRCQPQVMGAALDILHHAAECLRREANSVTDNPLVFPEQDEILSGGNFHAEPVAFAADQLALITAEIGNMSERRTAMLIDPNMSGLPAFLVEHGGLNSGFMIAQVTAAALASENKLLATPASVDTIPTSANQEDHVSMATHGARRLADMAENAAHIVAIELLAAAQGIEFHRPRRSSETLESIVAAIRSRVEPYVHDRYFATDIDQVTELVRNGRLGEVAATLLPSTSDQG